jgi:hypothetical protein
VWATKDWPYSLKVLIIAVFITATNPKESDGFTFGTGAVWVGCAVCVPVDSVLLCPLYVCVSR